MRANDKLVSGVRSELDLGTNVDAYVRLGQRRVMAIEIGIELIFLFTIVNFGFIICTHKSIETKPT